MDTRCSESVEPVGDIASHSFVIQVACENIRFSSLFVAGDVSRGGTSAIQRQKFDTDDVKSVRNPVRSTDLSTEQSHCFSYCLRMTAKNKRPQRSTVNAKNL